ALISLLAFARSCDGEAPDRCGSLTVEDGGPRPATLCVTERGASPRRKLRMRAQAGATGTYRVAVRHAYHDDDFHDEARELWLTLRAKVVETTKDGELRLGFEVTGAQDPEGGELYDEASLLRAGAEQRLTWRGHSKEFHVRRYGKGGGGQLFSDA